MIETFTLISLCVLYLIFFRPGTTPPLERPLVINRPGRYRVVLAPKLNLAQPFIESIAERIAIAGDATLGSAARFFAVRDKKIATPNSDVYLLAVVYRDGMLGFQGEYPRSNDQRTHHETIQSLANDLLANLPARNEHNSAIESAIAHAIDGAAREQGIEVKLLAENQ